MTVERITVWRPGEPLKATRLNETVDRVNQLSGALPKAARGRADTAAAFGTGDGVEAAATDDNAGTAVDGVVSADEIWTFVAAETRTERVEDSEDETIYVDVDITTSVTVRKPDGTQIKIELE